MGVCYGEGAVCAAPGDQNKLLFMSVLENTWKEGWEKVFCLISTQWNIVDCKLGREFKVLLFITLLGFPYPPAKHHLLLCIWSTRLGRARFCSQLCVGLSL